MDELLDIKAAAEFLRVSETSLRRWTNAGRLRCLRIGGRHERRFRRTDLLAFLESQSSRVSADHDHLCGLYTSEVTRIQQAAEFLGPHLGPGSVCLVVATKETRAGIADQLGKVPTGQIVQAEYGPTTTGQLEFWRSSLEAALRRGSRRLCVVADVSGGQLGRLPFGEILNYEREYEQAIAQRFPVTTLCQYDARAISGLETANLVQCHGSVFRSYRSEQYLT